MILFLLLLVFCLPFCSQAACIGGDGFVNCRYIDPVNGNDTYDGTSATYVSGTVGPWKRLDKAFGIIGVDQTTKFAYDTFYTSGTKACVYLMDGTHLNNSARPTAGIGILSSYLTVKAYPGASPKIIVPTNNANGEYQVAVWLFWEPHSYVTLDGIDISGGYYYALKVDPGADHFTLKNCKVHDSGISVMKIVGSEVVDGGNARQTDVTIEYNEIYNSGVRDSTNGQGINIESVLRVTIQNNYIHNIKSGGCIYPKGHDDTFTIQNNFLYQCGELNNIAPTDVDDYGAIGLGDQMDDPYIPNSPDNYEVVNFSITNNIIAMSYGYGLRVMGTNGLTFTNNTLYTTGRPYNKTGYDWMDTGAIMIYQSAPNPNAERSDNININHNLIIDSVEAGYSDATRPCITKIGGSSWIVGKTTATALTLDYNYYYRGDGNYRWRDGTNSVDTKVWATWKASSAAQDANSTLVSSSTNLIAIITNPTLPANEANSYLPGSAVPSNVGARTGFTYGINGMYSYSTPSKVQGLTIQGGTLK